MVALSRFWCGVLITNGVTIMSNGKTAVLLGATSVGRSEMPGAFETEAQRLFGDRPMVVLNCQEVGIPAGLSGRLLGHPDGYVTYGDDCSPPKGLLASLALARMEGRQPAIFLDDPDFPADPLVN